MLGECHKHCHVTAPEPPKNIILKFHSHQTIPAAPSLGMGTASCPGSLEHCQERFEGKSDKKGK